MKMLILQWILDAFILIAFVIGIPVVLVGIFRFLADFWYEIR